jgi:hypothetical protein
MKKSATEVMHEILFAAAIDSVGALKAASKGLPNTLLRDLNAIHANTTFADLPPELQAAITAAVRSAFAKLLREGYTVSPAGEPSPPRPPRPSSSPPSQHRPFRRPPPKREGAGPRPPGKGGGRPPRKPNPSR